MRYLFLDPGDEKLIETSELPTDGIAVALLSTGYDTEKDEVLRLSVVSLDGEERFAKTVKPQNAEEWDTADAAGGITPADVAEAPELYQFEEEVSDLFENAPVVVAQHLPYVEGIVESSWVTLPEFKGVDLIAQFCASHCTDDYRDGPATAATLAGIADYYGIACDESDTTATARTVAACYRALVKEHADERAAKGEDYWNRRDERLAEEAARNEGANATARLREKRMNQMNGLLWVAAGLIFISLIIQLWQRGGDVGFMVVAGAFAVFAFIRAVVNFRK